MTAFVPILLTSCVNCGSSHCDAVFYEESVSLLSPPSLLPYQLSHSSSSVPPNLTDSPIDDDFFTNCHENIDLSLPLSTSSPLRNLSSLYTGDRLCGPNFQSVLAMTPTYKVGPQLHILFMFNLAWTKRGPYKRSLEFR